ncbi:YciI family protein [Palleronia sp. KMU-117]|uniref:YciI family protein n=1 Tax=Palleronia sp. KMU-117 TaxID=3434108 RepID=UPI003D739330
MKYMMLHYTLPGDGSAPAPESMDVSVWAAYTQALIASGIFVSGDALLPPHTASTLRISDGVRDIQDGPYAASKEHLGGYYIVDVPDLDTALDWAARNPAAVFGAVEVRPVLTLGE